MGFYELSIASSAINAAKTGLSTVSHNIANSSSTGYTRQVIYQQASSALKQYNGVGMVGTGTTVYGIGQVRDYYLDKKYWQQQATFGEYSQKATQLNIIETIFNSLSTNGVTSQLNDLFEALSNLSTYSNDSDYKMAVVSNLNTVLNSLTEYASNLQKQQEAINEEIYTIVERMNVITNQIASLNQQIYTYELDGNSANDLRDKRASLIDELSQYVNTEVKTATDQYGYERVTILINGQEIVNNTEYRQLHLEIRTELANECDVAGLYDITFGNGISFNLTGLSGELKGLLDVRDGSGQDYNGIPYYINKLNEFVRTLASSFNDGTTLDGTQLDGVIGHTKAYNSNGETGILLFSYIKDDGTINTETEIDYTKDINIFNICLSQAIQDNANSLATFPTEDTSKESDNSVVNGFMSLFSNRSLFKEGGIYQFVNSLSSTLGIDTSQANNFQEYYSDMVSNTDNQRIQVSGVSLNEEMTYMIQYQQLYQAAAQLISTLNEIYNIAINGLGI